MLTQYDKALAPLIVAALGFLNQKYGFAFPVDDATAMALIGVVAAIVTYIVPNKKAA